MRQKPNKADLFSPRSYRLIALLSVLRIGLERLIAKRIAWVVVRNKILTTQQFGALPGRSAVDLTTCISHDVKRALSEGRTASMLTLDVKGAFDAVLPGRLARRMREQGWPESLVNWVASFAINRSVQIRLDGELGPLQSINCDLPQGFSVSPILFILYISPLFKMGSITRKFGYADNIAIFETQKSLHDSCSSLTKALKEVLDWGLDEGITFDLAKAELQHFSRKRTDKNPVNTPSVTHGVFSVSEKTNRPYTRWLGVYLDRTLSFKWHVRFLANEALVVANALRSFVNTLRGAPPKLLCQAVTACVLPIAYYGAET
ncbi:hypothetical protein K3495_g10370 [Podosphaera aphanis]|nr:hypothetical protein K3495_g10370 [Podosphaera aphanis]